MTLHPFTFVLPCFLFFFGSHGLALEKCFESDMPEGVVESILLLREDYPQTIPSQLLVEFRDQRALLETAQWFLDHRISYKIYDVLIAVKLDQPDKRCLDLAIEKLQSLAYKDGTLRAHFRQSIAEECQKQLFVKSVSSSDFFYSTIPQNTLPDLSKSTVEPVSKVVHKATHKSDMARLVGSLYLDQVKMRHY